MHPLRVFIFLLSQPKKAASPRGHSGHLQNHGCLPFFAAEPLYQESSRRQTAFRTRQRAGSRRSLPQTLGLSTAPARSTARTALQPERSARAQHRVRGSPGTRARRHASPLSLAAFSLGRSGFSRPSGRPVSCPCRAATHPARHRPCTLPQQAGPGPGLGAKGPSEGFVPAPALHSPSPPAPPPPSRQAPVPGGWSRGWRSSACRGRRHRRGPAPRPRAAARSPAAPRPAPAAPPGPKGTAAAWGEEEHGEIRSTGPPRLRTAPPPRARTHTHLRACPALSRDDSSQRAAVAAAKTSNSPASRRHIPRWDPPLPPAGPPPPTPGERSGTRRRGAGLWAGRALGAPRLRERREPPRPRARSQLRRRSALQKHTTPPVFWSLLQRRL